MMSDSLPSSTVDLMGLHLHVLGAALGMEKLHYSIFILGMILFCYMVSKTERIGMCHIYAHLRCVNGR